MQRPPAGRGQLIWRPKASAPSRLEAPGGGADAGDADKCHKRKRQR